MNQIIRKIISLFGLGLCINYAGIAETNCKALFRSIINLGLTELPTKYSPILQQSEHLAKCYKKIRYYSKQGLEDMRCKILDKINDIQNKCKLLAKLKEQKERCNESTQETIESSIRDIELSISIIDIESSIESQQQSLSKDWAKAIKICKYLLFVVSSVFREYRCQYNTQMLRLNTQNKIYRGDYRELPPKSEVKKFFLKQSIRESRFHSTRYFDKETHYWVVTELMNEIKSSIPHDINDSGLRCDLIDQLSSELIAESVEISTTCTSFTLLSKISLHEL